jgi:hypothetical protein
MRLASSRSRDDEIETFRTFLLSRVNFNIQALQTCRRGLDDFIRRTGADGLRVYRAVERVQAHHLGGREESTLQRHGSAGLSADGPMIRLP